MTRKAPPSTIPFLILCLFAICVFLTHELDSSCVIHDLSTLIKKNQHSLSEVGARNTAAGQKKTDFYGLMTLDFCGIKP